MIVTKLQHCRAKKLLVCALSMTVSTPQGIITPLRQLRTRKGMRFLRVPFVEGRSSF